MPTLVLQPDESTGVDSFLDSGAGGSNYGTDTQLEIGEKNTSAFTYRSVIQFDISSIPRSSIIYDATLELTVTADFSDNARTMRAYRILRSWSEGTVCWNTPWATGGCDNTTSDREATDIGSVAVAASESAGTKKQIVLTPSKVSEWVDSVLPNYGLLLKMDTELNDRHDYASSSHATTSYRPKLTINYDIPGTPGMMIVGLFKKWQRRTELYKNLLKKGAIPLGNQELMPI